MILTAVSNPTVDSQALANQSPSSAVTAGSIAAMDVPVIVGAPAVEVVGVSGGRVQSNALAAAAAQVDDGRKGTHLEADIAARGGSDFAGQAMGDGRGSPDSLIGGAGPSTGAIVGSVTPPGWPTSSASPMGTESRDTLRARAGAAAVCSALNPGENSTGSQGVGHSPVVFGDSVTGTAGLQSTWGGHCSALITAFTPTGWEDAGLTIVAAGILGAIVGLLFRKVMVGVAVVEHDISQSHFT